jgi:hypothetical protein
VFPVLSVKPGVAPCSINSMHMLYSSVWLIEGSLVAAMSIRTERELRSMRLSERATREAEGRPRGLVSLSPLLNCVFSVVAGVFGSASPLLLPSPSLEPDFVEPPSGVKEASKFDTVDRSSLRRLRA